MKYASQKSIYVPLLILRVRSRVFASLHHLHVCVDGKISYFFCLMKTINGNDSNEHGFYFYVLQSWIICTSVFNSIKSSSVLKYASQKSIYVPLLILRVRIAYLHHCIICMYVWTERFFFFVCLMKTINGNDSNEHGFYFYVLQS